MSDLFCPICNLQFDEGSKFPRKLPDCGHNVCTTCLKSFLSKNKPATLICPLDKYIHPKKFENLTQKYWMPYPKPQTMPLPPKPNHSQPHSTTPIPTQPSSDIPICSKKTQNSRKPITPDQLPIPPLPNPRHPTLTPKKKDPRPDAPESLRQRLRNSRPKNLRNFPQKKFEPFSQKPHKPKLDYWCIPNLNSKQYFCRFTVKFGNLWNPQKNQWIGLFGRYELHLHQMCTFWDPQRSYCDFWRRI